MAKMLREVWLSNEIFFQDKLKELGLPSASREQLEAAYKEGFGRNHRFIPAGLTREMLMAACDKAGIKTSTDYRSGAHYRTKAGIFDCDLTTVMQPKDADHKPFMLNHDEHEEWSKDQGGDGLSSAEEVLYLILRMKLEFGHVLFMGGAVRSRNGDGSGRSVFVGFTADVGLRVKWEYLSTRGWSFGCIPRKFTVLGS